MTAEEQKEFEDIALKMMKFLNDNFNPHVSVIITPISAEINDGIYSTGQRLDYVKD